MPPKLLALICLLLSTLSFCSQDLRRIYCNYSQESHFTYDPDLIEKAKINSIEKIIYYQHGADSLGAGRTEFFLEFNRFGNPVKINTRMPMGGDTTAMSFEYDSRQRLVRKTYFTLPLDYGWDLRPQDIYEWDYLEDGAISKTRRYSMINHWPVGDGTTYFPEKLFLYTADSIAFDDEKQEVEILSNHFEHFPESSSEYYPTTFKRPFKSRLTFHENGRLKRSVREFEDGIFEDEYGECGNSYSIDNEIIRLISDSLGYTECLPQRLGWLARGPIDTIEYSVDSIVVYFPSSVYDLWEVQPVDYRSLATIFTREQKLVVESRGESVSYNHRGTLIDHWHSINHYDDQLRILKSESYTRTSGDGLYEFEMELEGTYPGGDSDSTRRRTPGRYQVTHYEYHDCGLPKSETVVNSSGVINKKIEWILR